jgi:hypothetical protein
MNMLYCFRILTFTKEIFKMKKLVVLILAIALTACGTPAAAPTEQAVAPEPVVITVVVEPTQVPAQPATAVPAEPVVVTVVVEATQIPVAAAPPTEAPAAQPATDGNAPITLDDTLGAGWFVNMTRTGNNLSLRCKLYQEITFSVMPTDSNINQVDFYYRTQDKATGAAFEWRSGGRMVRDVNGNFVIVFSGEDVNANFRKPNAWLDYQFIGSNATGVVGRSEKIVQQVDYSNDCPQ